MKGVHEARSCSRHSAAQFTNIYLTRVSSEDQGIKGLAAIAEVTPAEASFVHFVLTETEPEQSSAEPEEVQLS